MLVEDGVFRKVGHLVRKMAGSDWFQLLLPVEFIVLDGINLINTIG